RILDIGCGPGALLSCLPAAAHYVGFDRNSACIERARRTHGGRGEFVCDDVANFFRQVLEPSDIAVAIGIFHHLDDDLASKMLTATATALRPGGRLITVDPCFHPDQPALQRW